MKKLELRQLIKESLIREKKLKCAEQLKEDSEYQTFFRSAMKKFGIKSPKELSGDKEKEFYNYVDKNYKAINEGRNYNKRYY